MSAPEAVDRRSYDFAELLRLHPPAWRDRNKIAVWRMVSLAAERARGTMDYSRWRAMDLPPHMPEQASLTVFLRHGGFSYRATGGEDRAIVWTMNFADPELFGYYAGGLFAQDESQVTEHPHLASLRQALVAEGAVARTVERGEATPVLVGSVPRCCVVRTNADAASGRPHGLYGNRFASASQDVVERATEVIDPPTISNILAIAAPSGDRGVYTPEQIRAILKTTFSAFRAAVIESSRVRIDAAVEIHTGFWGCGAFGGDRVLMTMLQLLAAELARVHVVAFYAFAADGVAAFREGERRAAEFAGASIDAIVERLAGERFRWGVSDGN